MGMLYICMFRWQADNDAEAHPEASFAFCGIPSKNFPDKQPLGFPFDRPVRENVTDVEQFLTPNMKVTDVKILHKNEILIGDTINVYPDLRN